MLTKRKKIEKIIKRIKLKINNPAEKNNKIPLFIFGCPRSGTNMLIDVIGKHKKAEKYDEIDEEAFTEYRLKDKKAINNIIQKSNAQIIAFKPILDSQNASTILRTYKNSKAIWIYRNYQDVVNSMIRSFPNDKFIEEASTKKTWKGEKISTKNQKLLKKNYKKDLEEYAKRSLLWILRNSIFYEQGLDKNKKILLINYENLVNNPKKEMEKIFKFLGVAFDNAIIKDIHNKSIKKNPFPKIDRNIKKECEDLTKNLNKTRIKKEKELIK